MAKQTKPLTPISAIPGPALYEQFQVLFAATNVPQQVPGFVVPPGASVALYPTTSAGVNAHAAYVGEQPDLLGTSGSRALPAGADVSIGLAYDNTGSIWVMGTAGDGVLVVVSAPQIG